MRFGLTLPAVPAFVAGTMLLLTSTTLATAADYGKPEIQQASAAAGQDIVATAISAGTFKTLAAALQAADLVSALQGEGPFTVFAPTDEAFAKLPPGTLEDLLKPENKAKLAAILKYHVVPGKALASDVVGKDGWKTLNGERLLVNASGNSVKIDGANVVKADIAASNGVIHVIDAVILPGTEQNVVGTARKAGGFDTLVTALKAADLTEALSGAGPFTVFAPTDEAFAKLPAGTLEDLLKPENKAKLTKILQYHVVSGKVLAADAVKLDKAATLAGQSFAITVAGDLVKVDNANVIKTDLAATNGVIHVIDAVILPRE